jgi:DNA-binding response OmpR family regulator
MSQRILVMDDDAYMRELMGLHLSNAGYEVLMAEDAVVAGHLVLGRRPDLILADIEMPFMNGLEFVQALRHDPSVSSIPVVFVSSRDDLEESAKALSAVAFLKKPVLADHLLTVVASQFEGGISARAKANLPPI